MTIVEILLILFVVGVLFGGYGSTREGWGYWGWSPLGLIVRYLASCSGTCGGAALGDSMNANPLPYAVQYAISFVVALLLAAAGAMVLPRPTRWG
jgi:hypothetical protein